MMKKKQVIWIGLGIAALLVAALLLPAIQPARRHTYPTRIQSVNHLDHVTFTLNTNPPASSPSQPR